MAMVRVGKAETIGSRLNGGLVLGDDDDGGWGSGG